jgi:putative restriction endonuclease
VADEVKNLHRDQCQVCGETIELPGGARYSEAAHIRPLGLGHAGPDVASNVLCLCPSDHIRFDHGAIYVDDSGQVIDAVKGVAMGLLRVAAGHQVDPAQLAYHRELWLLI